MSAEPSNDNGGQIEEYIVRTKGLVKTYVMGDQRLNALNNVKLDIRRGEYISIMGPSGSGKSTLFNMIGGLDKPSEGTVYIDEVDMAQLDAFELAWLRCRKIGYIFQTFNLIPVMTALENITLPMIFAGVTSEDMLEKGVHLLTTVGLGSVCITNRTNSPVGSSSVWRSRAPSPTIPRLFWRMSQQATST